MGAGVNALEPAAVSMYSFPVPAAPRSEMPGNTDSLEEWLSGVDDEGHLMRYLDALHERFKSPSDIIHTYGCSQGRLDPRFFCDVGVQRLGHRRLFEAWFRDHARV